MTNITTTDRIGNESQTQQDRNKVETLKKYAFKCYEDEVIVKLPYADVVADIRSYEPGVSALYQYKANSIYDPDLTGSGHQPLGRDTWAAIYDYYKVLETRFTIKIIDLHATTNSTIGQSSNTVAARQLSPALFGAMMDITATPPASRDAWIEATMCNDGQQDIYTDIKVSGATLRERGDDKEMTFNLKWTPDLFSGNVLRGESNGWTAVGSDPNQTEYATILAYNPQFASDTSAGLRQAWFMTKIEYIVAFKGLNRSLKHTTN